MRRPEFDSQRGLMTPLESAIRDAIVSGVHEKLTERFGVDEALLYDSMVSFLLNDGTRIKLNYTVVVDPPFQLAETEIM